MPAVDHGKPIDGENITTPRWICTITGNIEYCRERDRSPERARKKLRDVCLCGQARTAHCYRAGLRPGGLAHGMS